MNEPDRHSSQGRVQQRIRLIQVCEATRVH